MAYTQTQLLDAFCRKYKYTTSKLQGESKQEFLARRELGWATKEALAQLNFEGRKAATDAAIATYLSESTNVTL